ncbi:MAG: hypothetical protein KC484_04110, partial [Colwelliaceae bacterium]|nr:hypothetical protein [Colwelliaceae bacterium]
MALFRRLSFIMFFIGLIGCGGGDGGFDGGTDPGDGNSSAPITISLAITPDGENTVSQDTPLTISATVMQGEVAVSGREVTFSIDDPALAFFSGGLETVNTNSEGIAEVTINADSKAGTGNVIASVDSGDVSTSILFISTGDG